MRDLGTLALIAVFALAVTAVIVRAAEIYRTGEPLITTVNEASADYCWDRNLELVADNHQLQLRADSLESEVYRWRVKATEGER